MERSLKILLVDDDQDLLDLLEMLLKMDGADVFTALDYYEALEQLEADRSGFDIAVIDWSMPKINGPYLLEMIKDLKKDIPVIMMSAFWTPQKRNEAKKRGADLLLDKPSFEYQDLHGAILSLVKGNGKKQVGRRKNN